MAYTDQHKERLFPFLFSLPVFSWALYDFANTIFSSNITTVFFPFYVQAVVGDTASTEQLGNTLIAYANAASSFFLVILSPLFGVWIDQTGQKKKYLVRFAVISIICTLLMGITAAASMEGSLAGLPSAFVLTVGFFVLAKFFYNSSLVFYDAKLSDLAPSGGRKLAMLSGFGVSMGYLGTLVGLSVYLVMEDGAYSTAFLLTGLLYFLFTLPMLFFVKDQRREKKKAGVSSGYRELMQTFREMKQHKQIFRFMLAYFFVNDAIATTIAVMSVYAVTVVGFTSGEFILLYIGATIAAVIGSFFFGSISGKIGANKAFSYVAFLMVVALSIAVAASAQWMFWVAGALFGVAMGSVWVTSRTIIIQLTPEEKRGQFFGLFAFSGKVSSIVGPFIYGTITLLLSSYGDAASRAGLASLIILTAIGWIIHIKTKQEEEPSLTAQAR